MSTGQLPADQGRPPLASLTDAQRQQLPAHLERWIEIGLSTAPADRPTFERAARQFYALAGLPWHGNVVWVSSPLVQSYVMAAGIDLVELPQERPEPGQLHSRVQKILPGAAPGASLDATVDAVAQVLRQLPGPSLDTGSLDSSRDRPDSVCDSGSSPMQAYFQLNGMLSHKWREALEEQALETLRQELCAPLRDAVYGSVFLHQELAVARARRAARGLWAGRLNGQGGVADPRGPGLASFVRDICQVELPGPLLAFTHIIEDIARSVCQWYAHPDFVLACERPREIHLEPAPHEEINPFEVDWRFRRVQEARAFHPGHRLHRLDGPAMTWPDGWGLFMVHGIPVPGWVIEHPEAINVPAIESERNAEVRRVMLDRYGWERYVRESGAEVIDSIPLDHPLRGLAGARLLRKVLEGEPEPLVYLEMRNATPEPDGTFKRYQERVDPKAYGGEAGRSCHAAMASRWFHRDENGLLQCTFTRWQDYQPDAES